MLSEFEGDFGGTRKLLIYGLVVVTTGHSMTPKSSRNDGVGCGAIATAVWLRNCHAWLDVDRAVWMSDEQLAERPTKQHSWLGG